MREIYKNQLREMATSIGISGILELLSELPAETIKALNYLVGYSGLVQEDYKPRLTDIETELKASMLALRAIDDKYANRAQARKINAILWTPVNSDSIQEVGYNSVTKELRITFLGKEGREGSTYSYLQVPEWIYDALLEASHNGESVNAVYRDYLLGNYDGARCHPDGRRMTKEEQLASRKRRRR